MLPEELAKEMRELVAECPTPADRFAADLLNKTTMDENEQTLPKLPPTSKKSVGPHTLSVRRKALRLVAKGEMKAAVARKLGIDPKTLRQWIKDEEEGRTPGQRRAPEDVVQPMDEAPEALIAARREGETMAEMVARLVPVGTPEGVYKNMMLQKIMTAMESGGAIPAPAKMSDWKTLVGMANQLLGITSGPGRPPKNPQATGGSGGPHITIKLENLSRGPRLADIVLDADVVEEDDDEETEGEGED